MNLHDMLNMIAVQIKADGSQLIQYAQEDKLGGYHINEAHRKWPMGSLWAVEGETLYALIRQLKPTNVVQIGGWLGASATHMALACKANGIGHVTSVDNESEGQPHGTLIPTELEHIITLVKADGRDWLAKQPDNSIDLLFEDASHDTLLVAELSRLAMAKLKPNGLLINHDAAHDFAYDGLMRQIPSAVGKQIRDGLEQAHVYFRVYRADPSDCGLAISVKPFVSSGKGSEVPANQVGIAPIESDGIEPSIDKKATSEQQSVEKKPRGKGRKTSK